MNRHDRRFSQTNSFGHFHHFSINSADLLLRWINESDSTCLLLHLEGNDYLNILETQDRIGSTLMINILKAVVKCIHSPNPVLLKLFLKSVTRRIVAFTHHINEYLVGIQSEVITWNDTWYSEPIILSIYNLLVILKELLYLFPTEMTPVLTSLSNITANIRQIHQKKSLDDNVVELLVLVESSIKTSTDRVIPYDKLISNTPNDFRSIPIIPTWYDIHCRTPFLQKNIVDHKYRNVDHYLDVQFRLMREDFIRPLRCSIQEYVRSANNGRHISRLKESFIYHNVRVTEVKLGENGLLVQLKLDKATMPRVKWSATRRLMSGSLICFSCNKFDDFLVATISDRRDIRLLVKGYFEVIIYPSHESKFLNVVKECPDQMFVAIEPLSYFEAYRHILKCLQEFSEDTFPLKKYIVNVETQITHPEYLNGASQYDFAKIETGVESSENNTVIFKDVNVLKTDGWPTVEEFGMDESQYVTLKDALTREVSVIQGPPGTGKTFIGLRIVDTLMRNREIWDEDGSGTILVTCYTNHALDQFMEGIEPLCKQLLRIGGRCKSETLQKYCLRSLRTRSSSKFFFTRIRECRSDLNTLRNFVNSHLQVIDEIRRTLLPIDVLDVILFDISEKQANSVQSLMNMEHNMNEADVFRYCIKVWLGYYLIDGLRYENMYEEVDVDEEEAQRIADERFLDTVDGDFDDDIYYPSSRIYNNERVLSERDKNFEDYFLSQVNSDDTMDIMTARLVDDVSSLHLNERWRLYRLWLKLYIKKLIKRQDKSYESEFAEEARERLKALRVEETYRMLRNVKIIGATTTGAAKNRSLICRLKPKIVIVEEAAEVLESHIITSLTPDTKHLILIGDHIQLQPNATVYDLAVNFNLNVSLFERLIRNGLSFSKLKIQHRMRPNISELLVPLFYSELENHESVTKYENIRGVTHNLFFICHNHLEDVVNESKSRSNVFEAEYVYKLCQHLLLQGYESSQITVLTMYSAQMFKIRNLMRSSDDDCHVRVSSVDNYQGEENDIIICSFVRNNIEGSIGFLSTPNRINVAISRAKKAFYAIGNFDKMADVSVDLWRPLVEKLKDSGRYGYALELYCQNHTETKLLVSTASDFNKFPEGCCLEPCNKKLACDHICPKMCHVYDHKEGICRNWCLKVICVNNHRCPKFCHFPKECGPCLLKVKRERSCGHAKEVECFKDVNQEVCRSVCHKELPCGHRCSNRCEFPKSCGPCLFKIKKERLCGHTLTVECCKDVNKERCKSLCGKELPCGHKCNGICGDDCNFYDCKEKVRVTPPCGHRFVYIRCCQKQNKRMLLNACTEPCNEVLKCGHRCCGSCGECHQGRLHKKCNEKCERVLICGHICRAVCGKNCPPCDRTCENTCFHGFKCKHLCGLLCRPCRVQCNWKCYHSFCGNQCSEKCKRIFKPCTRRLRCKHQCIGINGLKCPKLCRICDRHKPKGKVFSNGNRNARFIQLNKCGHVVNVACLYKSWSKEMKSSETDDWSPKCPECNAAAEEIPFDMLQTLKYFPEMDSLIHGCPKRIRCGHPCIGICGEDCPKLCRICNKAEVEEIFFGNERDRKARFIQLPGCKHVFEFTGFKQWISQQSNEKIAIQLKRCPKCKTIIRKSLIFNAEIQQCLDDIEKVKVKLIGSRVANSQKRSQLIDFIDRLNHKLNVSDRILNDILYVVSRQKFLVVSKFSTNVELEKVSNILQICETLIEMVTSCSISEEDVFKDRLQSVVNLIRNKFDNNEQQLFDVSCELNLLKSYHSIIQLKKQSDPDVANQIKEVTEMFHSIGRFSDEKYKQFEALVNEIKKTSGVSNDERMVLKTMSFAQKGQWFKCPNGHPYCITEYGAAMDINICLQCQIKIDGNLT